MRATLGLLLTATITLAAARPDWQQLRGRIEATLHIPNPLPDNAAKSYGEFDVAPGVTAERISYATAYGLRVPAVVYRQRGASLTQRPALIVVNGHGGDKSSWYAYWAGILYARAGAVVLTYDPIGEYERNAERKSDTNQHDQYVAPDDMGRRMGGLMITDVMEATSYLAQRTDVDPKRVAALGYSMGSFITSIACAVETRLRGCVLAGGGDLDGPGGYWDSSRKMCQAIPYQSLSFLGNRGPAIYALQARHAVTYVFNGSTDQVVDIPNHGPDFFATLRRDTIKEQGSAKDVFEYGFAPNGGHRPYFLTKPVALWLEEKLKFPNWTRKEVEAMPETHISDWAIAKGLKAKTSENYEHGEGGTMALGTDIPAVSREELHALPEALWESQKDKYVYESWLARAKAAE
ncbi:MAG TPA: prolyl oligopeptidase family serine peptidase [Bryobacteraceae bacterium]|nr:prolyl oligopeptidase family serine peptidase [Bryobacteraceae bacterium]